MRLAASCLFQPELSAGSDLGMDSSFTSSAECPDTSSATSKDVELHRGAQAEVELIVAGTV